MFSDTFLRVDLRRILILTSFVVLLTGCGSNISNSGPKPTPIATPTFGRMPTPILSPSPTLSPTAIPSPTPTPSPTSVPIVNQDGTTAPNRGPVSINVANLNIYSSEGIQCPLGAPTSGNAGPIVYSGSDQLVLAAARLTYSQDEIQQMTEYLHSIFTSGNTASSFLTSPPATLRWVPGAKYCTGAFQITNNSNYIVQIPTVGIQITQDPQQNSYQYHTIDACTLLPTSDQGGTYCNIAPSGAGTCSVYFANIHIQHATANSIFTATPTNAGGCPELMISPNATIDLHISFDTSEVPNSFIYSIIPELTLSDVNGRHVVSLPQLASTLAFADTSQFSCYGLQGNSFVLEQPRTDPNAPIQYCM